MEVEQNHFRYIVRSDACLKDYPTNKAQHFKNRPPAPIELDGKWEVAMREIIYPNNWFNITSPTSFSLTSDIEADEYVIVGGKLEKAARINDIISTRVDIEAGFYETIQTLLDTLNLAIKKSAEEAIHSYETSNSGVPKKIINTSAAQLCQLVLDPVTYRVTIQSKDELATAIKVSKNTVFGYLGIDIGVDVVNLPVTGSRVASLLHHFPALFVYSNIVQYNYLGDTMVPLLRKVAIKGKKLQMVEERFANDLEFERLAQNYINDIEIVLCDDKGKEVDFQTGVVQITLVFKRVGYNAS